MLTFSNVLAETFPRKSTATIKISGFIRWLSIARKISNIVSRLSTMRTSFKSLIARKQSKLSRATRSEQYGFANKRDIVCKKTCIK